MQKKEWFIQINGKKIGPYSIIELKNNKIFTPDTLVWKEGYKTWVKARDVIELLIVFKDDSEDEPVLEEGKWSKKLPAEDEVISIEGSNFPFFIYWVLIFIIIIVYLYVYFRK